MTDDPGPTARRDDPGHRARRSPLRVGAAGALLTAIGVVAASGVMRANPDPSTALVPAAIGMLLLVVGHAWAARWRFITGAVLAAPAALTLFVGWGLTTDGNTDWVVTVVLAGIGGLLTLGTAALATWVGNRWGEEDELSVFDVLDLIP